MMKSYKSPLTTLDLMKICHRHPNLKHVNCGVYARDEIIHLEIPFRPCHIIVNLSPSYEEGSHWISIFLNRDFSGELVDSLALTPHPDVLTFLKRHCTSCVTNAFRLQSLLSATCGIYALWHGAARGGGKTFPHWVAQFSRAPMRNDQRARCFFTNHLAKMSDFRPLPSPAAWKRQRREACGSFV